MAYINIAQATALRPDAPQKADGGYEYDFVNQIPDRLVCRICQLPCREAEKSNCCGHVYCKSDIEKWRIRAVSFVCPMCRVDPLVTWSDLAVDREIKQLKIYCPNKSDGCSWVGELASVSDHLKGGRGCDITCSKCNQRVHHAAMPRHNSSECPCYCQYCNTTEKKEVISGQHKKKCYKYPLPCTNNCGQDGIPRCDMNKHKNVCPLEMIQCPHCEVGLARKDQEVHNRDYKLDHFKLQLENQISKLQASINNTNQNINTKVDSLKTTLEKLNYLVMAFCASLFILLIWSVLQGNQECLVSDHVTRGYSYTPPMLLIFLVMDGIVFSLVRWFETKYKLSYRTFTILNLIYGTGSGIVMIGSLLGGILRYVLMGMAAETGGHYGEAFAKKGYGSKMYNFDVGLCIGFISGSILAKLLLVDVLHMPWSVVWGLV